MTVQSLANDDVLAALAAFDRTAVPTASLAAELDAPKPYVTTHLQQLALKGLVGFNTHKGVRRWRLTDAGRAATTRDGAWGTDGRDERTGSGF